MAETLLSVGLDVGTSSTQLVVSRLFLQNKASSFTVPELVIGQREILYESPVYLTPILQDERIDGDGIRNIVAKEYEKAGITRDQVDTGAVIITGETSRKENAEAVLSALSQYAGDFVVATAGPDLESRLAARGSGAVEYSRKTGKTLLHMDIGGGTSNLALIKNGEILDTGCINVGGRLVRLDGENRISWISPALKGIFSGTVGETLSEEKAKTLAETLNGFLEMAAGLIEPDERLEKIITKEGKLPDRSLLGPNVVFSFSGGVADCMETEKPWNAFGDLGPLLGKAIRAGRLCRGEYHLGRQTIRATVIGAGCHSTQLSGSTVFYQNVEFPLKNLPCKLVKNLESLEAFPEEQSVLVLPRMDNLNYHTIGLLADRLSKAGKDREFYLCLREDAAKALGQALALRMGPSGKILCMDGIGLSEDSYLDVGQPVGPAIAVVVKTLILEKGTIANE